MKSILIIVAVLFSTGLSAQKKEAAATNDREKNIQLQAKQAKSAAKETGSPKQAVKREENTINTKDPGTDAVVNSTTGGRNAPSPSKDNQQKSGNVSGSGTTGTGNASQQGTGSPDANQRRTVTDKKQSP